jgi:hypothetical protein
LRHGDASVGGELLGFRHYKRPWDERRGDAFAAWGVRVLLDAGAGVDVRRAWGWTPLMRACNTGALEVARLLVEACADVEATAYERVPGGASELLAFMESRGVR